MVSNSNRNAMSNPYESPNPSTDEPQARTHPLLTQQRVFWFAVGLVLAAFVIMFAVSQTLIIETPGTDSIWSILAGIVNYAATFLLFTGLTLLVVYHWFPDPNRKCNLQKKGPRDT